jgi:hypothetical protein
LPLPNIKNIVWAAVVQAAGVLWPSALTDWIKRKQITINGASKTATFEDDFTSYTDQTNFNATYPITTTVGGGGDRVKGNPTTDKIDFTANGSDSSDNRSAVSRDLTSVDDEKWVLRTPVTLTSTSVSGVNYLDIFIGMSNNTSLSTTAQDFIGFNIHNDPLSYRIIDTDNAVVNQTVDGTFDKTPVAGETIYVEIIRLSATKYKVTIYADSDYSESLGTLNGTCASTTNSLRYFKVMSIDQSNDGSIIGTVDKFEFYNGVTTVENIPSQQTIDYDDDFTGTDDWVDTGADFSVSTVNDRFDFHVDSDAENDISSYDLENVLGVGGRAGGVWTLRMPINFTTLTTQDPNLIIGLSDLPNTTDYNTAQDWIGVRILPCPNNDLIRPYTTDGAVPRSGADVSDTFVFNTSDTYYLEIRRISDTKYEVSLSSTTQYERDLYSHVNSTDISASLNDLRYIKIGNATDEVGGTMTGYINQVQFWNNISEVNPTTLTDFVLPIKIQGDADLQRKTAETMEELGDWTDQTAADLDWVREDGTSSTNRANAATNVIDWDSANAATSRNLIHDLGSALGTTFRIDGEIDITSLTNAVSGSYQFYFGIFDGDETVTAATAQDGVAIYLLTDSGVGEKIRIRLEGDGATAFSNQAGEGNFTRALIAEKLFVTILRRTDDYTIQLFADKARTILLEEKSATDSGLTGLQYVGIKHYAGSQSGGALAGTLVNVRVWDGITNPVEQETATYTEIGDWADQPTADGDWVSNDTAQARGNITNDNIDLIYNINSASNDAISHDLGFVLDDKFILQGKINYSTLTGGSNGGSIWMGVSSSDSGTGRADAQHFIGLQIRKDTDTLWSHDTDNAIIGATGDNSASITWAASTDYYWRIVKDGLSYTVSVYSDSGFSILLGEATGTLTSTADFQYIKFMNLMASNSGTAVATVDDINLWNGVTSPNATARKFVFTDNDLTETATEYSSETISYDPINGDLEVNVRIPTLTTGADTIIQMYYDYSPSANPDYTPELMDMDTTAKVIDEDFTDNSNGWITSDDTNMSVDTTTNFRIDYDLKQDGTNDTAYVDVGILPDNWILDFDINPTTYTQGNATDLWGVIVGISSVTGGTTTSQDALYTYSRTDTTLDDIYLQDTDGTTIQSQLGGGQIFTTAQSTGVKYYRLTRVDSTNAKLEIFSNADRLPANLTESQTLVTGALANLRYIKVQNHIINNSPTSVNSGIVDNIRLTTSFDREQSVYDANYKAVYHLQGNSLDSTIYGNDGTETSIDDDDWEENNNDIGVRLDGTNDYIGLGGAVADWRFLTNEFYFETWLLPNTVSNNDVIFDCANVTGTNNGMYLRFETTSLLRFGQLGATDTNIATGNIWNANELQHLAVRYDGATGYIYRNGIEVARGSLTANDVNPTYVPRLGWGANGNDNKYDGYIGKLVINNKFKSKSSLITTYNAEKADSNFVTFGTEQTQ